MDFPIRKGLLRRTVGHFRAVDQVDLDVREGETLGLLGESGCGKSTLGRMLVGLLRPTSGRVEFRGRDISALPRPERRDLHRHLQIVFQDTADSLDPRMNIREIVSEGPRAHGLLERHRLDQVVGEYLNLVGMPKSALDKYPHEFSGGQRQRIGIARALIMKPAVIVADEPISALDVSIQAHILTLFDELKQALNLTYVFISHNLAAVDYIADRTAVMYRGVIVEIASGRDLIEKPSHPFTQALLAALPGSRRGLAEPELYSAADITESSEVGCRFRQRCPFAQAVCAATQPPLRPIGEGHRAACHFAEHVSSAWTEREGSCRMPERATATTP